MTYINPVPRLSILIATARQQASLACRHSTGQHPGTLPSAVRTQSGATWPAPNSETARSGNPNRPFRKPGQAVLQTTVNQAVNRVASIAVYPQPVVRLRPDSVLLPGGLLSAFAEDAMVETTCTSSPHREKRESPRPAAVRNTGGEPTSGVMSVIGVPTPIGVISTQKTLASARAPAFAGLPGRCQCP